MTKFCVIHNAICYNDTTWHYPDESIEVILHRRQEPALMAKCPKCTSTVQRIEDFLKRNYRRR